MRHSGHCQTALQVLLFSATLHSPEVREIAERVCYQPIWIDQKARIGPLLAQGSMHVPRSGYTAKCA